MFGSDVMTTRQPVTAERRQHAIALLSLDIVYPFWTELGLRLKWPERARDALRGALGRHADPRRDLTADDAEELDRWIGDSFIEDPSDRDDLFAWHMLLGRARRDPALWDGLFVGLPSWVPDMVAGILRDSFDLADIDQRMDGLDGHPLSPWDERYFVEVTPVEGDDPHDRVRDMIGNRRLEESLRRLRQELGAADRERFLGNAERVKHRIDGLASLPPLRWPPP